MSIKLYQQVIEAIRNNIYSGEWKPGGRIPPQRALAEQFDVSMITIKKAVNELINEKILEAHVGKGTFVSKAPFNKNLTDKKTLGLVLNDITSPYFSLIMRGIEAEASDNNFNVLLSNSDGVGEKEDRQIKYFAESGVDGIIIASMTREYLPTNAIQNLHDNKYPYTVVSFMPHKSIYHVDSDQEYGGYLAGKHLAQLGFTEIAMIAGEPGNLVGKTRKTGFINALKEYQLEINDNYVYHFPYRGEKNDYKSGKAIGEKIINVNHPPEAVFCYNDLTALGVQSALLNAGVKIPGDIAIMGFDDIERSRSAPVPLSTIRQQKEMIGRIAVKKVLSLMDGHDPEVQTILTPELIVRDSTPAI